jgi:PleD family two-component response regulator
LAEEWLRLDQPVTFSAGLATFDTAPSTVDEVLRAADALLYEGKRAGKASVRSRAESGAAAAGPAMVTFHGQ